jgi:S1-C subfamily serine protease
MSASSLIAVVWCIVVFLNLQLTVIQRISAEELAVDPQVIAAQQERIAAIERAKQAAIAVLSPDGQGGGSGIVISADGFALTNYHVVQPCGSYMHCSMADGKLYDAVVVGIDATGDVALIKLLGRDDFPIATMGNSDLVRAGQWCFVIGNPFLLATDFQPTVTYGLISGVHRYQYPSGSLLEYADCLQTDASINPGNSGGPLFNQQGELIGINGRCSFEKRGRVNVGVGYAISINQIKHFLGVLHSGRLVDHATLGATVNTDSGGRIVVSNILEDSDAFRRGLRYRDQIISFGGRRIQSVNDFKNVLGIFPKSWRVPLVYARDGKQTEIFVRLEGLHAGDTLFDLVQGKADRAEQPQEPDKPNPEKQPKPDEPEPEQLPLKPADEPKKEAIEIPDAAKQLIEDRRGFANYYFNRINRDRLWNGWTDSLQGDQLAENWKLTGKLQNGQAIDVVIGDTVSGGRFPSGAELIDLSRSASDQLTPDETGGLLLALTMWRALLNDGIDRFGQVYYWGTLPLISSGQTHDVLIATRDVMEMRIYFDAENGLPLALEMFADVEFDPCELYFADYRQTPGGLFPFEIRVEYAGRTYGTMKLDAVEFVPAKESK